MLNAIFGFSVSSIEMAESKAPRPFDLFEILVSEPVLRKLFIWWFQHKTVDQKFITAYLKHVSELSYQLFIS